MSVLSRITNKITRLAQAIGRPKAGQFETRHIVIAAATTAIVGTAATITHNPVLATFFGVPAYLLAPGYLAQVGARRRLRLTVTTFVYALGISLLFWMLGALALNTLLPLVHLTRPLQLRYLLTLYVVAIAAAILLICKRHATAELKRSGAGSITGKLVIAGATVLPVLATLGATTLNNGGPGTVTITMLISALIYILAIGVFFKRFNQNLYPAAIYGIGLSLLLMYSLRSWHVLGWDIHQELQVFTRTLAQDRWSMSYFPGLDYNACLSITILPTVLTKLFHTSPEYTFKVAYQLIFAVTPVAVYAAARRYLLPVLSFLAAVLFVAQTWYFELMPALARQEIAILFFALFLLVLTDNALTRTARRALLYLFATGIILSHYSTAYLWITMCVFAYIVLWVIRLFSSKARSDVRGLTWPLIAASIAMLWLWEGPITNTYNQANNTFSDLGPQLSQAFTPATITTAIRAVIIGPPNLTTATVQAAYRQAYADLPGTPNKFYPPASYASYTPVAVDSAGPAGNVLPTPLATMLRLSITAIKGLINNVMTALGIVLVSFYFLRRYHKSNLDFMALCLGAYGLIFLILMVPYLQQIYNLPRVGLQSFTLLVVPIVAGLWFAVRRSVKWGIPAITIVVALMLAGQSGLVDHFTGGARRITMDQQGTSDAYYVQADEVKAAQWLAANRAPGVPIYADPVADLRLESYGPGAASNEKIFPNILPINSYVYLIDLNTRQGRAYYEFHNVTITYNTPTQFLNTNKNLLYVAGGARVYR